MKPMQHSSSVPAGSRQLNNHNSSGALLANESAEAPPYDTLIGRKVWTRWPEDNSFYEALIKDYDPVKACLSLRISFALFKPIFLYNRFLFPVLLRKPDRKKWSLTSCYIFSAPY